MTGEKKVISFWGLKLTIDDFIASLKNDNVYVEIFCEGKGRYLINALSITRDRSNSNGWSIKGCVRPDRVEPIDIYFAYNDIATKGIPASGHKELPVGGYGRIEFTI